MLYWAHSSVGNCKNEVFTTEYLIFIRCTPMEVSFSSSVTFFRLCSNRKLYTLMTINLLTDYVCTISFQKKNNINV